MSQGEALMTAEEVAKRLRMSPRWVRLQASEGKMPSVRLGKNLRFRHEDVQLFIERNHRAGAEAA